MIESVVVEEQNLTIITGTGKLTKDELVQAIQSFYQGTPTINVLWNLLEADVSNIISDEVSDLANFVKSIAHSRPDGKTALVATWDATFGMGRMYQTWADVSEQTSHVNVFRTIDEAHSWMGLA